MLALVAGGALRGPLAVVLALAALALAVRAQLALAAHDAHTSLPPRLPRALAPEAPGRRTGLAFAGLVASLLFLCALLLAVLTTSVIAALAGPEEPGGESPGAAESARGPGARTTADGASAQARGFEDTFPGGVEWATARPLDDDTPVLVVRPAHPDEDWRAAGPLYLRGRVLERFTATGLDVEAAFEFLELDAQRAPDGWCALLPAADGDADGDAAADPGVREHELEQLPLGSAGESASLLFTPAPLVALDCPGARMLPDGTLHAPAPAEGPLRFRTRSLERRFERTAVPAEAERAAPRRTLALPAPSPELAALQELATQVTHGAADDRERVALVLAFFRTQFVHDPEPDGIPGLAGLARFLERRSGGCTHHAAAATLMLRSLGVPARVVTGFLARLPTPDAEAFVATPRGGHAWLEVCFAGIGWVTCDPTPPGAEAARDAEFLAETGPRRLWTGAVEVLTSFLGGENVPWRRLRGAGLELWTRLGARAWLLALVPLAALAWLVLRRRGSGARAVRARRARAPETSALERLALALARAGVPRPPACTLREHARTLVARAGPQLQPLEAAVETLYRTRFGGVPWSRADEDLLARALRALAATGRRAPGAPY